VLLRRYGEGFDERLHAMFEEAGLPFARELDRVPNSLRALAVGELARDRGVHDGLHLRLFDAYWVRGLDIGDEEVLVHEASEVGLEAEEVRAALAREDYRERIAASTAQVAELGAGGVPAWLIDERLLVPGAQPHEVFERVLERLGHAPAA